MRRTYGSKKDDGNLDHKNKIDARSSAFDAFYIHNIKLNKKETSSSACSNQINVASKKIRKRKYVKRIVKDASQRELPHPGDPGAQSVLLTPDKSIHVNKPPDPFDLLLRSSPTLANSPILVKKSREKLNIKKNIKYNCSFVDCTGCENVNATKANSLCCNTSDVKSHQLIVEVEDTSDPKYHDESISRIVKCMPVLNDINKDPHFKGIKDNHRLTATYRNSPAAGNSPLCSTPFQVKYRCKSIFNISPISKNINNSPKVVINTLNGSSSGDEDDNRSQCETSAKLQFSLVTHDTNGKRNEAASKAHTTVKQANLSLETEELHTFSTSELEPCYGFAKTSVTDDNNTHIVHIPKCLKNHSNDIVSKKSIGQSLTECKNQKFEQFEDEVSTCVQDCLLSDSSLLEDKLNTIGKCTSKNSSCDSGNIECADRPETARQCNRINFNQYKSNSCLRNENNYLHKPNLVVALEKMDDAIFCKYYKKYKGTETMRHQFKVFKDLTNFEQKENFTELSNASYNTDCGDNLEEKENLIELSNDSYNKDCGNNMEEIENQIELSNNGNNLEEKENLIELSNNSYNKDCGNNMEEKENQIELSNNGNNLEEKENLIDLSNDSYNIDCGENMEEIENQIELSNNGNNLEEKENLIDLSNDSYNIDCGENMEEIENQIELSNNGNNLEEKENLIDLSNDSYNIDCGENMEEIENQIELSNNGNNLEEKENLIELSNNSYNTDCVKNMEENENQIELSNTTCDNNFYSMDSFSSENTSQRFEQTFETNISPKEDAGISYVTTRRRHEVVNNSIIILPDNSFSSCDVKRDVSAMCDNTFELPENEKSYAASLEEYVERGIISMSNESAEDSIASKHEDILLRDEVPNRKGNMSDVESNGTRERDDTKLTDRDIVSGPKVPIVLQPGKKWERSLSIYKRMTSIVDINHSLLDYEQTESKGRKYRQSVIDTMQMQKSICSLHNESINGRRSTFICKPSRSTIKLVKENCNSRASLCPTTAYEDLKGFLSDDCDDTIVDLSKLSIGDSVHEVTVVENFHEASRIATARDYVLRRCNQAEPLLFDECYPDTALKNCHKIGEGVYGEVFLWRARDGEARVLKVIPIAGDIKVNGEPQKGYHEIISEIVIAMELSALRAPIPDIEKRLDEGKELDSLDLRSVENATDIFNEVLAVRCVRGAYPARLLELWELYDECHGSDNDNPGALPQHQHYLVLELRNAGRDLESYSFTGADQAYAVLLQLAFGLAVAEEALQFEHRDLHWGNVLVSPTDQEYATFLLRGRVHRVPRRGAACVVIDYSLSRVSLRGAALYSDLADDDSLFEAVGDRQFQVYRLMRDRLGNEWKNFEPYTNVLWLHYVADKMVTALRYERPNTKLHRHYLGRLRAARRHLLAHASAADFVLAHAAHADL